MVYALVNVAQEFAYVCDKNNKICVLVICLFHMHMHRLYDLEVSFGLLMALTALVF